MNATESRERGLGNLEAGDRLQLLAHTVPWMQDYINETFVVKDIGRAGLVLEREAERLPIATTVFLGGSLASIQLDHDIFETRDTTPGRISRHGIWRVLKQGAP
jgi:hypothetical protein